jgi:hypothetical protein
MSLACRAAGNMDRQIWSLAGHTDVEQGESVIRHDSATLAEFRSTAAFGTSVRVRGFPIYLGGWKSTKSKPGTATGANARRCSRSSM